MKISAKQRWIEAKYRKYDADNDASLSDSNICDCSDDGDCC